MHIEFLSISHEYFCESFSNPMEDHLAIGKCSIGCAGHCLEIFLALWRTKWCTGKFPIRNSNAILRHGIEEDFQIICCHLMPKSSAAAVHHNHNLIFEYTPLFGNDFIMNEGFIDALNFKIMIPRAEGSDLINAARNCLFADLLSICVSNAP